nr:hypothetical protein GCM10020185_02020 [Pseudomonas brassicacearum subsp. brassicacearum]
MSDRSARLYLLQQALKERILILDGGMGTMIQSYKLEEQDYRGKRFADWPSDVKGNNDLLVLSRPDVIGAIEKKPTWMPAPTSWRPTPSTPPRCPRPTTACRAWPTS